MIPDEENGIVKADLAEFNPGSLGHDAVEQTSQTPTTTQNTSSLPELENAIRMQFTKTYTDYIKLSGGSIKDSPPNPAEISPELFNDLVYSLRIKCVDPSNSTCVFYEPIEIRKIHVTPILRETYGDFFFTTDTAQRAGLRENDPDEIADFSKIHDAIMSRDKISALENLCKVYTSQYSYILSYNPYLNILRTIKRNNGFETGLMRKEKEFLHGVFVEAEKDGKFRDKNADNLATLDVLKGSLYGIQLKHLMRYAEKVNEKETEKYWSLLEDLKRS